MIRKKIRIRKKNFTIFIFIIFIIIYIFFYLINFTTKLISTHSKEIVNSKKEDKYLILNNIHKEINYFNDNLLDRYINYKRTNPNLNNKQIIKNVNMNLDLNPYTDSIKAKKLNTKEILVNKYYHLDKDYVPNNLEAISHEYALDNMRLVRDAKDNFEKMAQSALENDLVIIAMSCYRSYSYQLDLYNRYKNQDGEEKADRYSGRAGYSEHQTGLAVDVFNEKDDYTNFGKTNEYKWMLEHAHEYGFILRFPEGLEKETGYDFEPWHYRYVGVEIASYIKKHNISYEKYCATHF